MTQQSRTTPPLFGWEWNEQENFPDGARDFIVAITGLREDLTPIQIGTGFIFQSNGNRALVLTAAHNISDGIRQLQNPHSRAHRTALAEFLPKEKISAGTNALRVMVQNGEQIDMCRVALVAWDEVTDLAVLSIVPQDDEADDLLTCFLRIGPDNPSVGDLVTIMGFAGFESRPLPDGTLGGAMARRPILRVGRVTHVHPEGVHLHRSACVETTIPVFPGMSGGPAFIFKDGAEPLVFGILSGDSGISSSPGDEDLEKSDRRIAGHSVIRLIPREVTPMGDGAETVSINFTVTGSAKNPEIDGSRFSDDWIWNVIARSEE